MGVVGENSLWMNEFTLWPYLWYTFDGQLQCNLEDVESGKKMFSSKI